MANCSDCFQKYNLIISECSAEFTCPHGETVISKEEYYKEFDNTKCAFYEKEVDTIYKEIQVHAYDIEECVSILEQYKCKGLLVSTIFNGITLYSDTVTLDSAYIAIIGETKADYDNSFERVIKNLHIEKEEHERKIPELSKLWMDKGREILPKEKWTDWDILVPRSLHGSLQGFELGWCLNIIQMLNSNETFLAAKEELLKQGHTGGSLRVVCDMVIDFSQIGREFVKYLDK